MTLTRHAVVGKSADDEGMDDIDLLEAEEVVIFEHAHHDIMGRRVDPRNTAARQERMACGILHAAVGQGRITETLAAEIMAAVADLGDSMQTLISLAATQSEQMERMLTLMAQILDAIPGPPIHALV